MKVQRIFNDELVKAVLTETRLWATINEDTGPSVEDFYLDTDEVYSVALLGDDDELHGFVLAHPLSGTVVSTHVCIAPDYWGHKDNVKLGQMACALIFEIPGIVKQVASIPVTDKEVLRFAQRVGFQREGMNKASFLRNGELLDQYYVGLTQE